MNLKTKELKHLRTFVFLFFSFSVLPFAASAAIGVSPERLEFDLKSEDPLTKKLFVENLNNFPVQVRIEMSKFSDVVLLKPQQMTLPPGTLQDVKVEILEAKKFKDEIKITAYETTDNQLTLQTGIKIPIKTNSQSNTVLIAGVAAAALAALIFLITRRRNTSLSPD